MIAYSGRYRVEGSTITTKVEVAWNEAWVGGEQVRHIRFEGDKLLHREPADAASEHVRQDRARDRGLAAGQTSSVATARNAKRGIDPTNRSLCVISGSAGTPTGAPRCIL